MCNGFLLATLFLGACNAGPYLPTIQDQPRCPSEAVWTAEGRWKAAGVVAREAVFTRYTPSGSVEWEMRLPRLDDDPAGKPQVAFDYGELQYHVPYGDDHVFHLNDLWIYLRPSGQYELSLLPSWKYRVAAFEHEAPDGTRIVGRRVDDFWSVTITPPNGKPHVVAPAGLFQCRDEIIVASSGGEVENLLSGEGWRRFITPYQPAGAVKRGDHVHLLSEARLIPSRYTKCDDFFVPWRTIGVHQYGGTFVVETDLDVRAFADILHPRAELCPAVPTREAEAAP